MLGWNVSIYRQKDGGSLPATDESPVGARLAVWQAEDGGLDWIIRFAREGKAIDLGGDGYPNSYTAPAEYVIPLILDNPPHAREVWQREAFDLVDETWAGKTTIDRAAARECRFNEWLLIIAWDES